jgi:hypothetical protein
MPRSFRLVRSVIAPITHTSLFRRVAPTVLPPLERLRDCGRQQLGRERRPAWTYNLIAHPDAFISVRGRRTPVRATPHLRRRT